MKDVVPSVDGDIDAWAVGVSGGILGWDGVLEWLELGGPVITFHPRMEGMIGWLGMRRNRLLYDEHSVRETSLRLIDVSPAVTEDFPTLALDSVDATPCLFIGVRFMYDCIKYQYVSPPPPFKLSEARANRLSKTYVASLRNLSHMCLL